MGVGVGPTVGYTISESMAGQLAGYAEGIYKCFVMHIYYYYILFSIMNYELPISFYY